MQTLVEYSKEKFYIYEAKFKNLNANELAECDRLLKSIVDTDYKLMFQSWNSNITKQPIYGEKYFVEFANPFSDVTKFSATPGSEDDFGLENASPVDKTKVIRCIGIADKFGRIFLQGIWENDEPAYIEYKKAERKKTKSGSTYITKEGWYLTRKNIECYRVKKWYSDKKGESPYYFVDEVKSKGAWGIYIDNDIKFVKSLDSVSKDVVKYTEEIAKKAAEEKRTKEKQEEIKKFWDIRKDYKCMGCANGWGDKIPSLVQKAYDDPDAKWFEVEIGNHVTEYWCDTYKFYYTADSSD